MRFRVNEDGSNSLKKDKFIQLLKKRKTSKLDKKLGGLNLLELWQLST